MAKAETEKRAEAGRTFTVEYSGQPWRTRKFSVRGVCQFDVLNPCWDNRPEDVLGRHWSGECDACPACSDAALSRVEQPQ